MSQKIKNSLIIGFNKKKSLEKINV